jgi:hypothetical protein
VRSAHPNGEQPAHRELLKHQHLAFSEKRSTAGFRFMALCAALGCSILAIGRRGALDSN